MLVQIIIFIYNLQNNVKLRILYFKSLVIGLKGKLTAETLRERVLKIGYKVLMP